MLKSFLRSCQVFIPQIKTSIWKKIIMICVFPLPRLSNGFCYSNHFLPVKVSESPAPEYNLCLIFKFSLALVVVILHQIWEKHHVLPAEPSPLLVLKCHCASLHCYHWITILRVFQMLIKSSNLHRNACQLIYTYSTLEKRTLWKKGCF